MTEDNLLNGLRGGDPKAYKQLYKDHYIMIKSFVLKNNGNDTDAQDLFQESLISFIQNIRKKDFQLSSKISTYIYSIARNKWLYKLRSIKDTDSISETHHELVSENDLILEKQMLEGKHNLIAELIKTISEDCQKLLLGYYIKKQKLGLLADTLGMTKSFVKVKKGRCISSLRKKILAHPDYLSLNL